MRCALCGAENENEAKRCSLCDAQLDGSVEASTDAAPEHVVLEPLDASTMNLRWSRLLLVAVAAFMIALPWYTMSDLFVVPVEVREAREHYELLRDSYLDRKDLWNEKKNQIVRSMLAHQRDGDLGKAAVAFQDLPLEVFMAYLADDCDFLTTRYEDTAIFPEPEAQKVRLVISKPEWRFGFIPIMVSLEVELQSVGDSVIASIIRLRRGDRMVSSGLAWSYFASELHALRRLETFAGGVRSFRLYQRATTEGAKEDAGFRMSWSYLHRAFISER